MKRYLRFFYFLISIAVLEASYCLDCVDGMLARHKKIASKEGHLFDFFTDELKAAAKVTISLQPPRVDVTVPEAHMGDVTGNLAGRRARISGTESQGGGFLTVRADMPLSGLTDYHTDLKSMTQGQGSFTMEFSHYDPVPHEVQRALEAEFKPRDAG